jgi:Rrf2 family nitric oxide-sensitive transcriptional repressor
MKVVHNLGRTGYLDTLRGKGGGLRLAVPPADINLGRVVRETEGALTLVPCFDPDNPEMCTIAPVCVLKGVLHDALRAFLEILDRYSLADLIGPDRSLQSLLAASLERNRSGRSVRTRRRAAPRGR